MSSLHALFAGAKSLDTNFDVSTFVDRLDEKFSAAHSSMRVNANVAIGISNESFDNELADVARDVFSQIDRTLGEISFEDYNKDRKDAARVSKNMALAAAASLIAAQGEYDYKKALLASTQTVASNNPFVINSQGSMTGPAGTIGAMGEGVSIENYNEKSQRDFAVITAGFSLSSARQDEFTEAAYRTTVIQPQEGGAVQVVPYIVVVKDRYHKVNGALMDTGEVNLVDAYRDPSILENNSTDLIPVIKTGTGGNAQFFVPDADVAWETAQDDAGNQYQTSYLKFDQKLDLIGISNHNQLVNAGILTIEDTIDPAGNLKDLLVRVAGDGTEDPAFINFKVARMATATFVPKLVGDTRDAQVNFETERLLISGATRTTAGATTTAIDQLAASKWTVEISVKVDGKLSLSRGNTLFTRGPVTVEAIRDEDGVLVDMTSGAGAQLVAMLGELSAHGFKLNTRFTNTNRRKRGDLLQTRAVQFRHPIWMHSPITLPLSTLDEQGPGEVAKALSVANDIRNSANGVTAMLNYVAQLKELVGDGSVIHKFGDIEGALSIMMRATYRYGKLDFTGRTLDTIRSGDRWNDLTSAILNFIKGHLFPAYRDSNIESVFQVVSGNINERPKFLILTDREIANYLQLPAEDRILGSYLKYDVFATNNKKFDGKILVVPTRENPGENDILSWGQFFFVPPIVGDLPITRDGSTSREICAIPFNRHVNNIPFAIEIDVVGLREVMSTSQYNAIL